MKRIGRKDCYTMWTISHDEKCQICGGNSHFTMFVGYGMFGKRIAVICETCRRKFISGELNI
jgi:hypothetical protein